MARLRLLAAISLVFVLQVLDAQAGVEERERCWNRQGCVTDILVHGEISWGDGRRLGELLEQNADVRVYLDSPGGSLGEALEMGRLLREHQITAVVDDGALCVSACVFVLAGASKRVLHVNGRLGIHRSRLPLKLLAHLEPGEAEAFYSKLHALAADYLEEMRMPIALFDAMQDIPAEDIRYLSIREAMEMGLVGLDPVTYDLRRAALVARYDDRAEDLLRLERARIGLRYRCVFSVMQHLAEEEGGQEHQLQGFAFSHFWDNELCPHAEIGVELEQASNRLMLEMLEDGHDIVQLRFDIRDLVDFTR